MNAHERRRNLRYGYTFGYTTPRAMRSRRHPKRSAPLHRVVPGVPSEPKHNTGLGPTGGSNPVTLCDAVAMASAQLRGVLSPGPIVVSRQNPRPPSQILPRLRIRLRRQNRGANASVSVPPMLLARIAAAGPVKIAIWGGIGFA